MPSSENFAKWQKAYEEVVQKGRFGKADAQRRLDLAARNMARARRSFDADDPDQALVHAEAAMVNAADAVLALGGYRIRGKTRSHEARFAFPGLPEEFAKQRERIKAARKRRNVALYESFGSISVQLARDVMEAAESLIAAAAASVG